MHRDIDHVLLSEEQLSRRVSELGAEIARDYEGKNPTMVCILKGAIFFFTDLVRAMPIPLSMDFMAVSSYGNRTKSSGEVEIRKDLSTSIEGKDVIIVDDMIASGGSMLDVARQLKSRGAGRVFLFATFGLFTSGMDKFDKAYAEGCFDRIFTTDLVYQSPELLKREYYCSVGMSRYVAALIDALHRGDSMAALVKPEHRIRQMLELYRQGPA